MYTRKRRKLKKHRGGGKALTRSMRTRSMSKSRRYSHVSLPSKRKRNVSKTPEPEVLKKCISLKRKVLLRKIGIMTRYSRKEMACRITLLERLILEQLDITNDENPTRKIIDDMVVDILASNEDLNRFISMNDSSLFLNLQDYDVEKQIEDIFTIPMRGRSADGNTRILRSMIFVRENGTIPHYFLLYYEDGKWYIYSSFGSDFVSIGTQKIEATEEEIEAFMIAMDKYPRTMETISEIEQVEGSNVPSNQKMYRTYEDETIIREFMRKYFLSNPRQPRVRTENSKGDTVTLYYGIWEGVEKETEECVNSHLRVVYVPEIKTRVDEVMPLLFSKYKTQCEKAGITLASTSLVASATGVSATPGRMMQSSGP